MAPRRAAAAAADKKMTETTPTAAPAKVAKPATAKKGPGRPRKDATAAAKKPTKTAKTNGTTAAKPTPAAQPKATRKRKASSSSISPEAPKRPKLAKGAIINQAPAQKLYVYVIGEGSAGELGLGSKGKDVKRPRINQTLVDAGTVQIAPGGMHGLALTHDNKILSWGVNDQGALGRKIDEWEGGLKDMKEDDSDDADDDSDSDAGMNPFESTPYPISEQHFPENTIFTQVAAGDSASFAVTDDGHVYGWGAFLNNEGKASFARSKSGELIEQQRTPMLIPSLKGIKQIACGANHALAVDKSGKVWAWGSGEQNQLGRRVVERTKTDTFIPTGVAIPRKKLVAVGCGPYHSMAIDKEGGTWAWGLNSYGEAGIPIDEDKNENYVKLPTKVESLEGKNMKMVEGGSHHSVGVTHDGECLIWGRVDGGQAGMDLSSLPPEDVVLDSNGKVRVLTKPTPVPRLKAVHAATANDHVLAVSEEGKAYSWGFGGTYQLGHGSFEDVYIATMIDNTAVRDKKLNWVGAGGQYSILAAPAEDVKMVNGTT